MKFKQGNKVIITQGDKKGCQGIIGKTTQTDRYVVVLRENNKSIYCEYFEDELAAKEER